MILPAIIKMHQLYGLSYREAQVVLLVALGLPHKGVADILGVKQKTVATFLEHVRDHMQFGSSVQLTHRMISDGVIDPVRDWKDNTHEKLKAAFSKLPPIHGRSSSTIMKKILLAHANTKLTT